MKVIRKLGQLFHPARWFLIIASFLLLGFRIFDLLHPGIGEEVIAWSDRRSGLLMLLIAAVVFFIVEALRGGILSGGNETKDYMHRLPFSLAVDVSLLVITFILLVFKLPTNY